MHEGKQAGSEQLMLIVTAICACLLVSCDRDVESASAVIQPVVGAPLQYRQYVLDQLPDLSASAHEFSNMVMAFLEEPDPVHLETARTSWLHLHHNLVNLEVYLNRPSASEALRQLWFDLDAWPLEPGFIDSIPEYPNSGIINDLTLDMSETTLRSQHGATSPMEVSTGMHAAEYLLWQRPIEDYQRRDQVSDAERESGLNAEQLGNNRRREMLRLIVSLLTRDLATLERLVSDSLSNEPDGDGLRPTVVARLDLLMVKRTLIEAQGNSTELHSIYSQSWLTDSLTLLHQISRLIDQQTDQSDSPASSEVRDSLADVIQYLSNLDTANKSQLGIALDKVARLELQLDQLFGSKAD